MRQGVLVILILFQLGVAGAVFLAQPATAHAATTQLSNITETNDKGTNIFRSNIWDAYRFVAGSGATVSSVTLDLDPSTSNYSAGVYQGGVIRFYNDNNGAVGTVISGTLSYTSTNSTSGDTVYSTASGGTITIPTSGHYWIAFTCSSCANIDYRQTSSTAYTGVTNWATILDSASVATSNNYGSSWNTPYSTLTYGTALFTIDGAAYTDTTPPTVSLTAPSSGATVGGSSVSLSANASDNASVAGVTFYVDGTKQGSEDTTSPYDITWDSTATSSGSHTAFAVARDSSNNYATSTSISFTVDNTPPVLSSVAVATTSSAATATWTTNEAASTRLWVGLTSSYSTSTPEADISTRVTSHSASLSGLSSCTQYHYAVVSRDNVGNSATSTDATFTTGGCIGSAPISATNSSAITTSAGGTLTQGGLSLTVPTSFTATSSQATFQASQINGTDFFASASRPSGMTSAGNTVFHLVALTDATTTLSSFSKPLTLTLTYTASDVSGLNTSSLKIYRYDSGIGWTKLTNCTVDTSAKTVTCDTSDFSDFAIFGTQTTTTAASAASSSSTSAGAILPGYNAHNPLPWQTFDPNVPAYAAGPLALATTTTPVAAPAATTSAQSIYDFTRNLHMGMTGTDVQALQTFLDTHGDPVASSGPGAPGDETDYFGSLTKAALERYQDAHAVQILAPVGLTRATGYFGPSTRTYIAKT